MLGALQNGVMRLRRALLGRLACVAEERGAATAEYTLVTLVAATIAFLLLNWAQGGALTNFFQTIFDKVVGMFS
jgi:Flp pilus assembly pilin Flp